MVLQANTITVFDVRQYSCGVTRIVRERADLPQDTMAIDFGLDLFIFPDDRRL
jgi:hypothetical protein